MNKRSGLIPVCLAAALLLGGEVLQQGSQAFIALQKFRYCTHAGQPLSEAPGTRMVLSLRIARK